MNSSRMQRQPLHSFPVITSIALHCNAYRIESHQTRPDDIINHSNYVRTIYVKLKYADGDGVHAYTAHVHFTKSTSIFQTRI